MKKRLIPLFAFLAILANLITPAPVSARPAADQLLLNGADWLVGHGVDVFYPDIGPTKGEGYVEITPFCGYAYCFQCIELTTRLYAERLGYRSTNGRLPDTVSIPNDLITVIELAREMQSMVKQGKLDVNDPDAAKYLPFADLTYHPNGGPIPPRVGDLIIYTYRVPGDHIMVVNRIAGNKVQVVQQNIWTQTKPAIPVPDRLLEITESVGRYTINNAEGWIHSPRMKALILPTSEQRYVVAQVGGGTWRWDEDGFLITMDREGVTALAAENGQEAAGNISQTLSNAGAFVATNEPYMRCALLNTARITAGDARFTSNFGLKGLDIRIQFTGETLRLRPHGGKYDNQWITIPEARCGWEGNPI